MSDSDYFEVIDSNYELIEGSIREEPQKGLPVRVYEVKIKPSKSQVDLSLLESQFYEFELYKFEQKIAAIQRRYSDFAVLYEVFHSLSRCLPKSSQDSSSQPSPKTDCLLL